MHRTVGLAVARCGVVLLVMGTAAGCGYALVGKGSVLPDHVRRLVVVPFENRTQRPEVEQRVTEEVTREFATRGRYEVIADAAAADAMLAGAITDYRTVPVEFDEQLRATRVEATVRLEATLRDLTNDEVLWSQSGFVFRGQFEVPAGEDQLFSDRETLALDQIAREAAGALVTSILEGF